MVGSRRVVHTDKNPAFAQASACDPEEESEMKRDVMASAWVRAAAFAAMGLWAVSAAAGDLKVGLDIRIGEPPPPPPPPVVVVEERPAPVVVVDDAWIVGPRRRLYDA